MYDAPGIGLAAPQVNVSQRVIVMDCGPDDAPELHKMINPEIVERSEAKAILEEGCLSIPKQTAEVEPTSVDVRYLDVDGQEQMMTCEGFWPPAYSMRSTISTGCCSSIICHV